MTAESFFRFAERHGLALPANAELDGELHSRDGVAWCARVNGVRLGAVATADGGAWKFWQPNGPATVLDDREAVRGLCVEIGLDAVPDGLESPLNWRPPNPDAVFTFASVDDLLRQPPTTWRVVGALPQRGIGVVWGGPGSGKTFVLLDLCFAIARGIPWQGRRTKRCSVAYVACEGSLRTRVQAYLEHNTLTARDVPRFRALESSINLLSTDKGADLDELISALYRLGDDVGPVGVVVVDTLNRAMPGGDENASKDMGAMVAAAQAIAEEFGCLVLFVHHSGKDEAKGSRGHSSLKGAVDLELSVKRDGDIRTLAVEKLRDGVDQAALLTFRLATIDLGAVADHDPDADASERVVSCVVVPCEAPPPTKAGASGPTQKAILTLLGERGPMRKVDLRAAVEAVGHSTSGFYSALRVLLESGDVTAGHDYRFKLSEPETA
jgi:KaiC/GvpD/RAD55 family RecA-like ATPase